LLAALGYDVEAHTLSIGETAHAGAFDGADVHEDIL
jgi:hypothetical protein